MFGAIVNLRIGTKLAIASGIGILLVATMIASQITGNSGVKGANENALRTQNTALAQRRVELQTVVDQFDGDIRRFKELRTSAAARLNDANRPKKQ